MSVAGESMATNAYGPFSSNGISIVANVLNDYIQINATCYDEKRLKDFTSCVMTVLDDIHDTIASV